jgi:hypothetical protein
MRQKHIYLHFISPRMLLLTILLSSLTLSALPIRRYPDMVKRADGIDGYEKQENTDMLGGDFEPVVSVASDPSDCSNKCNQNWDCIGFVVNTKDNPVSCWLKKSLDGGSVAKPGVHLYQKVTSGSNQASNPSNQSNASYPAPASSGFPSQASSTHYEEGNHQPACGKIDRKGHVSVAMSENHFGELPHGSVVGACGKCFKLTATGYKEPTSHFEGAVVGASMTVIVDNLCPADGNQVWCRRGTNDAGRQVHFDLYSPDLTEQWKGFYQGGNLLFDVQPIEC